MADNRICPACRGEMPPGTLDGHCPRCLARIVFGTPGEPSPDAVPLAERGERSDNGQESRKESAADSTESDLSGQRIGRYKLLEKIGEGGFGVVYMAEQLEPVQRKLALKLIKPGMDSRAIIARFEAERQALALMDHPNIARFYDAGIIGAAVSNSEVAAPRSPPPAILYGRPYFVMELVRGTALTEYCDQQQLPTRTRLELFVQVCQAVQHAHQKGIIHRDLKPSNVLVTLRDGQPVPKIIDFGIAKALAQKLTDKTLFTGFAQLLGTPAYMSPEQAGLSGLDIDTRSDIYSLGVLLYELLTGVTPFDRPTLAKAALDEIRRLIRETDPPKPSTRVQILGGKATQIARQRQTEPAALQRSLSGDLDWIVMKCLEKDRIRRYETANGLARDVERHLNDEPVTAAAPSKLYCASKFILRNKTAFASASALLLLLVAGVVASAWEALRAGRAERRARQVASVLTDMLEGIAPSVAHGRDTTLLREILDRSAERIKHDQSADPPVQKELWLVIGGAYSDAGAYAQAEAAYREAVAAARRAFGDRHSEVSKTLVPLAGALWNESKFAEAEAVTREAISIRKERKGDLGPLLNNLGLYLREQGKLEQAATVSREGLQENRRVHGAEHRETLTSLNNLAMVTVDLGNLPEAEKLFREALVVDRKVAGTDDLEVATLLNNLASVLREERKLEEAESKHREVIAIHQRLLGKEHPYLASSLNNLARVLCDENKLAEAEEKCLAGLAMRKKLLGDKDPDVAISHEDLARIMARSTNRLAEAEREFRACLGIRQEKLPDHWTTFRAQTLLGNNLLQQQKYTDAESVLAPAYDGLKRQDAGVRSNVKPLVEEGCEGLARFYETNSQPGKAAEWRAKSAGFDKLRGEKQP